MSQEKPTVVFLGAGRHREMQAATALRDVAVLRTDRAALTSGRGVRIALLDLAVPDVEGALRALEELHTSAPDAQLVALAAAKDPDLILRAMRAGAREFVVLDEMGALAEVVQSLARRAAPSEPTGQIIALFPAKGGVGATTLAASLAGALAEDGKRVVLVDFDRHLGDVLVLLDMPVQCTMSEVLKNAHRFDRDLLHSTLARHPSGVFVLTQADYLEDGEAIGAAEVPALLQVLARHFDYVVCDGLRGFDELSVAVLDAAHRIELVVAQDVVTLGNAQRCLQVFGRLGYRESKFEVLVNRFQKQNIDLAAIAENLGVEPRRTAANDYAAALGALNRGVLLQQAAPRSKLTQDLAALAMDISGAKESTKRGGLLRALFWRTSEPPPSAKTESKNEPTNQGDYDESQRAPEAT
jgi:pilus assembly protein CpaE